MREAGRARRAPTGAVALRRNIRRVDVIRPRPISTTADTESLRLLRRDKLDC